MQNNHHEKCSHCGASIQGRYETLSAGLCRALVKFYSASRNREFGIVHLQKDCNFTKNEFTNAQKLRYFGLISKCESAGYWELTFNGHRFCQNKFAVAKRVFVFRNQVKERSLDTATIAELLKETPYWLKRENFIKQSSPAVEVQAVLF